ncbi:HicB family protein [Dissulfurispira thermophila]|uniref:HicB family protein n=2 Tax=root TaxID=1 RepID=A0A7G1H2Q3_9BACT|nr:type II toxin-antitoxin system HicB family antitoxin [Dissulfurispira thermophila]BCB97060.1 HicB family protein [Dissulfurispira thermophila]
MREFTVIIEQDEEGYYIAEVPQLKGCHTQARSFDELLERIKEAIQPCLEVYGEETPKANLISIIEGISLCYQC